MRRYLAIALGLFLLTACSPIGRVVPDPSQTPPPPDAPRADFPFSPTPTSFPRGEMTILHSASLSLAVDDPSGALSALQAAVVDAGGFVASGSSWSSPGSPAYASLSARVPPEALPELRRAVMELSSQVQSDSMYSQDVTLEFQQLQERLQAATMAENHLWQLLIQAGDPQLATSLTIARELVGQEKANLQRQITDYLSRATLATFDVTLNAPAAFLSLE